MHKKIIKRLKAVRIIFIIIFFICMAAIFIEPSISAVIKTVVCGLIIWMSGKNREKTILGAIFILGIFYLQEWIVNIDYIFSFLYLANAIIVIVNLIFILFYKKAKIRKSENIKRAVVVFDYLIIFLAAISIYVGYQNLYSPIEGDGPIFIAVGAAIFAAVFSLYFSLIYAYIMYLSYDPQFYGAFYKENPNVAIRDAKMNRNN